MRKIELILYILKNKDGRNKLTLILITILQSLLIIGINNIQKIIIGVRQIPIVNIFLDRPFLYLYLVICWSYVLKNSVGFYKKRKISLKGISKLDDLIKQDIANIEGHEIEQIDQFQFKELKKTAEFMGKIEKEIRKYITSILDVVFSLYLLLFIIVLIEPIEIKQYYLFLSHIILNAFLFYNLSHSEKKITSKFDKIVPEYNQVLEKLI